MPRLDFALAVKGATPDQLRDRVECAYLIYTAQGVRAAAGTFSPMNALWRRQFDIDENETNCVNYKYCLVDAPGVSNSCID